MASKRTRRKSAKAVAEGAGPRAVLTGEHFMSGDDACAEGAIAAGCRFYAGYPITPSSEIAERMARRLPEVGGHYIQMEDELASLAAVLGARWGGLKAMTATSGPGFSLMQENIGLAVMTETPCVVVDVQRGGPSTGLPTLTSQSDMMQAKWGSHGDYEIVAFAPASPQEMFDLTVKAFNVAERLRTPVILLADEVVGHMYERVVIPPEEQIERAHAPSPPRPGEDGRAPQERLIPPMPPVGEGFRIHQTGLTHDERGYPSIHPETQAKLIPRLREKILAHRDLVTEYEAYALDDAEIALVAYGSVARSARHALKEARARGLKVGLLRLITIWPFPEDLLRDLEVEAVIVPEGNQGQVVREVERFVECPVRSVTHPGGALLPPQAILSAIEEVASRA